MILFFIIIEQNIVHGEKLVPPEFEKRFELKSLILKCLDF